MSLDIIPRTSIGLSARVTNIDHITSRPLLRDGLDLVLAHHPGVNKRYLPMTRDQVAGQIRSINLWRANEYSYVLHPTGIYEFAGQYQAAHAKGYNDRAYGVLFLIGTGEELPDVMIEQWHHLTGVLAWTGRIKPTAWLVQHGWVASTACPGNVKKRWAELGTARWLQAA